MFDAGRWSEARVSADGPPTPCAPVVADALAEYCSDVMAPGAATDARQRAWADSRGALDGHQTALWYLSAASERPLSAPLLETHLRGNEASQWHWNDLAAAYYNSRRDNTDWRAYEAAWVAVDRALALAPDDPRALYNRALILESSGMLEAAEEAWQAYLVHAESDDWARIATQRLASLEDGEAAKTAIREQVSGLTAQPSTLRFDLTPAMENLARANLASALLDDGTLLEALGADPIGSCDTSRREALMRWGALQSTQGRGYSLLQDTLTWLCGPQQVERAGAVAVLATAIRSYYDYKPTFARERAAEAAPLLEETGSPLACVAHLIEGTARFAEEGYDDPQKLESLQTLLEAATRCKYPIVVARGFERLGSTALRRSRSEEAIAAYRRAEDVLAGGHDESRLARIRSLYASSLATIGRHDAASNALIHALEGVREAALPSWRIGDVCISGAAIATRAKAHHMSELYADCAIRHLPADAGPTAESEAYVIRGMARQLLGKVSLAQKDFEAARAAARRTEESIEARLNEVFVDAMVGDALVARSPLLAIAPLQAAADFYEEGGNAALELHARQSLVAAFDALGQSGQADLELSRVLERLNSLPNAQDSTIRRWRYQYDRTVYERQLRAQIRAGAYADALAALVGSRQPERFGGVDTRSIIDAARPRGSAGRREVTLVFAWLGEGIVGWRIDESGELTFFEAPDRGASSTSWYTLIERAAGTGTLPIPGGREAALSELYDALIRPATSDLPADTRIHIMPDGPLFGLPWPALWDREAERYLVQQFHVDVAVELSSDTGLDGRDGPWRRVDVFADPSAGGNVPLASVEREAAVINEVFSALGADVLRYEGRSLTRESFEEALFSADVVHYAGHGEVDIIDPAQSRLILRRDPSGRVLAAVAAADLDRLSPEGKRAPRLVVLAACDTAAYSDRLPHGLAVVRPLLELGTREVVGALRPIDDKSYQALMERFYRAIGTG
ncbi:MAG: CHAT domain-containing protein, partial [Pseudomonadota bacterium]